MDLTLEDNMAGGSFFCATLTGRRGGHTPFVQAGAETPDTGAEAVKRDRGSSCESHSGRVGTGVWSENVESCGVVRSGETDGGSGGAAAPPGRSFRSFWAPVTTLLILLSDL